MAVRILRDAQLADLFESLALLTKSGMSTYEALTVLRDGADDARQKALYGALAEAASGGGSFSEAIGRTGAFPAYAVRLTAVGEATGDSAGVFGALGDYYEKNDALAANVKSAVVYPAVMLIAVLGVLYVLFSLVMPLFSRIFTLLGVGETPLFERLLGAGYVLDAAALGLGLLAAALLAAFLILNATARGRGRLQSLFYNGPFTRRLAAKLSAHRFAYALSVMLSGGIPFDEAIPLAAGTLGSAAAREQAARLQRGLDAGEDFASACADCGIFPGAYAGMVGAGVRAGRLDEVLMTIASRYEQEADRSLGAAVSSVEPALVAVLSVIVGLVLLSVMMPLVGIISTML
ncbi:MAG: type II secretion system F family protein [Oscillospiraceae bacterium]|nr:type II secretion system F family protein [Oscillospiraceae bacterium]